MPSLSTGALAGPVPGLFQCAGWLTLPFTCRGAWPAVRSLTWRPDMTAMRPGRSQPESRSRVSQVRLAKAIGACTPDAVRDLPPRQAPVMPTATGKRRLATHPCRRTVQTGSGACSPGGAACRPVGTTSAAIALRRTTNHQ